MADAGHGPLIISLSWVLTAIVVGLTVARFYVRARVLKAVSADDWTMLVAVILQLAFQCCITVGYTYGLGKHDADLSFSQLVNILKWCWISTTPAITVSIVARISITILLMRIFGSRRWLKWFLVVTTTLQSIFGVVTIIVVWVQCDPVQGLWNPLLPAKRWDPAIQQDLAFLCQSLFTFSDLTYVLLPVWIIWDLNMPSRRKIGLCMLMGLSLFTMAASIMKTVTSQSSGAAADSQYRASLAILWSAIEQSFVIIMGNIPPLQPVSKFKFTSIRSLGSSLVNIVGRSSRSQDTQQSSRYANSMESDTQNLARKISDPENDGTFSKRHSVEATTFKIDPTDKTLNDGNIHRNVDFSVTYDQHSEK